MLTSVQNLAKGFQLIANKSWEKFPKELENIRQLSILLGDFRKAETSAREKEKAVIANSLVSVCGAECVRICGHILFLTSNALYKNAYDDIRYILESIVQSAYLDMEHPNSNLLTKLEIWREIEGKRDYRAQVLIGKLDLGVMGEHKALLEKEYSRLSQKIHFGHKQVIATLQDIFSKTDDGIPARIDATEIKNILESMKTALDIFLAIYVVRFVGIKKALKQDAAFLDRIKAHKLPILCKLFDLPC
jgi:hypothetical protein